MAQDLLDVMVYPRPPIPKLAGEKVGVDGDVRHREVKCEKLKMRSAS
jgi:hypothetical protein